MPGSIFGNAVRRTEDPRFLRGEAQFVEDLPSEGPLHAVFVRSFVAHARIGSIDPSAALSMPGVAGVFTSVDLGDLTMPPSESVPDLFARPLLARAAVRFVGEPVAVVLAETRAHAVDAAEAVVVEYEPLPVAADLLGAVEPGAPVLFPEHGSNVAHSEDFRSDGLGEGDDAPGGADVVVQGRFVNQRVAPIPMESNGALVEPDEETGGIRMWVPSQAPFFVRDDVTAVLGLSEEQVRVIAPAVGGGFGAKGETYPEQILCAALALRLGRAVRYTETRSENLLAMAHGRAQVQEVEMGVRGDGTIVGLRVRVLADMGAYPGGTYLPWLTRLMACGPYRIPRVDFHHDCVVTNTTPVGAYRGAGRPEATAMLERAMDLVAAELDLDPAEVRRRNLIGPDEFPHETASGATYDVGAYEGALDAALRLAGYQELRTEQAARRLSGDRTLLGIGVSTYVEITGWGSEFGSVEVDGEGNVTVLSGLSPHGQGHETSLAQIASGLLGLPMERVRVLHSDTALLPSGGGTMGSRSLQKGGSAVYRAGEDVREQARRMAAHLLEAHVDDVAQSEDGRPGFHLAGAPDRFVPWPDVAAAAADAERLPEGIEPGLAARVDFENEGNTFPFGSHVAVVEVDAETGFVRLLRHVAVDDCGRILNPMLVDGQVHGGVAQGAAQALFEEVRFDEDGNPLTGSLMAYEMPSAAELPNVEIFHTETPTPLNPLGAKGIGEAGSIGSTPAVQSAVIDALSHLGVRHLDMPLTPERVWRAIRDVSRR